MTDELLKEALVKKYAKLRNIPEEEARKLLSPILEDEDKMKDILETLSLLDSIDTKPGTLSDEIKEALKSKAMIKLGDTIDEDEDDIEKLMKKALRWQKELKIIESILGTSEDPRIQALESKFSTLERTLRELVDTLRSSKQNELTKEIVDTISKLNESIQKQIEAINKRLEKLEKEALEFDIDKIKRKLEKIGWSVKPPGSEEWDIEALKKKLEKYGFKVEPGFITWDRLKEILEEERKKWEEQRKKELEEAIERDRIEATKETITEGFRILGQVLRDIFKPVVRKQLSEVSEELEKTSEEEVERELEEFEKSRRKKSKKEEEIVEESPEEVIGEVDLW